MLSKLKAAWSSLTSGGGDSSSAAAPADTVEYNGYRIKPAPYRANSQYQTAGSIEKDTPEGVKRHQFIRADIYANWDDAVAVTTSKAKQIIDQLDDRMFK